MSASARRGAKEGSKLTARDAGVFGHAEVADVGSVAKFAERVWGERGEKKKRGEKRKKNVGKKERMKEMKIKRIERNKLGKGDKID